MKIHERLGLWLSAHKMSQAEFAVLAGLSPACVSMIISGKRGAGKRSARLIHNATAGAISATELLLAGTPWAAAPVHIMQSPQPKGERAGQDCGQAATSPTHGVHNA